MGLFFWAGISQPTKIYGEIMSEHWSDYWQQGYLTSFGGSFDVSYSGILKIVWDELFKELKNGFETLDLATGNGALPVLIDQSAYQRSIFGNITAIDLAKINEIAIEQKYAFKNKPLFISNVSCEHLELLTSEYDLITSQFGIEYSDIYKSILSAKRKLKKDGKIGCVIHHSESSIIQRNKRTLKLITSENFDECVNSFKNLIGRTDHINSKEDIINLKNDSLAESYRSILNQTVAKLSQSDESSFNDSELPNYINYFMRNLLFKNANEKKDFVHNMMKQFDTLEVRLKELTRAAVSANEMDALLEYCQENGLENVKFKEVYDENKVLLAWFVVFKHAQTA